MLPRYATSSLRSRAFTLVEVLVVVAIVGIAGAIVVPQMLKAGTLQVQGAGRMVIADLIIAQNEAIAQQAPRRVVFDTDANSYRLTDDQDNTLAANWRTGALCTVDFTRDSRFRGVRLESVNFQGGQTLEYDDLGAPVSGGTLDLVAGATRYRITVAAFTGRVTITPVTGG